LSIFKNEEKNENGTAVLRIVFDGRPAHRPTITSNLEHIGELLDLREPRGQINSTSIAAIARARRTSTSTAEPINFLLVLVQYKTHRETSMKVLFVFPIQLFSTRLFVRRKKNQEKNW
jgi:hypothetical protein